MDKVVLNPNDNALAQSLQGGLTCLQVSYFATPLPTTKLAIYSISRLSLHNFLLRTRSYEATSTRKATRINVLYRRVLGGNMQEIADLRLEAASPPPHPHEMPSKERAQSPALSDELPRRCRPLRAPNRRFPGCCPLCNIRCSTLFRVEIAP
jgi:hypothetical protein